MNSIRQKLDDLNSLVISGKLMDAFEKYYHDDVSMQENNGTPTVGKESNRLRELDFLANVTEFRSAEVKDIAIGENVSTVIWHYDYTHKEWGVRNYTQVSVQEWKDGKIVRELFIYSN